MSAAGDALAAEITAAVQRHGPQMDLGEPLLVLHRLTLAAVEAMFGPGNRVEWLATAIEAERELEAAAQRRPS